MMESVRPTASAIVNESQTLSSTPVAARSEATGRSTASWRTIETIIAAYPTPVAWNAEVRLIAIAAGMKQIEIILRAGLPMESISCEAAKNESSSNL